MMNMMMAEYKKYDKILNIELENGKIKERRKADNYIEKSMAEILNRRTVERTGLLAKHARQII
jgi:hypothetical protein